MVTKESYRVKELFGRGFDAEEENLWRIRASGIYMPIAVLESLWEMTEALELPSPMKFLIEQEPDSRVCIRFFSFEGDGEGYKAFRRAIGVIARHYRVAMTLRTTGMGSLWESEDLPGVKIVIMEPGTKVRGGADEKV